MKIVLSIVLFSILCDGIASMFLDPSFLRGRDEDCECPTDAPTTTPTTTTPTTTRTTTTPTTTRTTTTPTTTRTTTTPTTTRTTTTTTTTTTPRPTTTPTTTIPPPPAPPRIALGCPVTVSNSSVPTLPNACQPGWTAFRRIKGVVCLKIFVAWGTEPQAQAACVAQNATLSGVENSNERDWIHQSFLPLVTNTTNILTIWLGAMRKPQCAVLTGFPQSCQPPQTGMFEWTDPTVTGTDGFCPWWLTDPDNASGRVVQSCLQFAVMAFPGPAGQYGIVPSGLDDTVCTLNLPGYVCSKPSTV